MWDVLRGDEHGTGLRDVVGGAHAKREFALEHDEHFVLARVGMERWRVMQWRLVLEYRESAVGTRRRGGRAMNGDERVQELQLLCQRRNRRIHTDLL